MPVRPEKLALYPGGSLRSPEWLDIRSRIQNRAGNACEQCGVKNHALGGRLRDGTFLSARPLGDNGLRLEWPQQGTWAWCGPDHAPAHLRIIRIVCTVAHLNHDETDNRDENLRFWCQRCHNRHDAAHRKANRQRNAAADAGQTEMELR